MPLSDSDADCGFFFVELCFLLCCCMGECAEEEERKTRLRQEQDLVVRIQHRENALNQREKRIIEQQKKLDKQLETLANMNNNATNNPNPSAPVSVCNAELEENEMNQIEGEGGVTNY